MCWWCDKRQGVGVALVSAGRVTGWAGCNQSLSVAQQFDALTLERSGCASNTHNHLHPSSSLAAQQQGIPYLATQSTNAPSPAAPHARILLAAPVVCPPSCRIPSTHRWLVDPWQLAAAGTRRLEPSSSSSHDVTSSGPARVKCSRCLAFSTRQCTCVGSGRLLGWLWLPWSLATACAATSK